MIILCVNAMVNFQLVCVYTVLRFKLPVVGCVRYNVKCGNVRVVIGFTGSLEGNTCINITNGPTPLTFETY